MTDDSLKEFEEMFDLSSSKDDENTQAEEYGHSKDSEEPFEELAKEVSSDIKNISDNGKEIEAKVEEKVVELEDPHDIIKDVMSKEHKEIVVEEIVVEEVKIEPESTSISEDIDFDTLPDIELKKESKEKIVEAMTEIKEAYDVFDNDVKEDIPKSIEKEEPSSPLDEIKVKSCSMMENDKMKWSLKSPSVMYEPFYHQKKVVLDSCIIGGQVEFSLWSKELEDAQVDVVTEVFDQQVIIKQMEAVQQFRNRVKYIGVRVNNQYFLFDRFTPLLRGYLARIQYLKPVLKQEGLILEHMGDVEMYYEKLRGLHKSVADTEKNLAAAYEMLSRKVTICMELPPVERYSKADRKERPQYQYVEKPFEEKPSEELSDFDDLPTGAEAGPEVKKSGPTGWDSL
jgi:hypothetical protein